MFKAMLRGYIVIFCILFPCIDAFHMLQEFLQMLSIVKNPCAGVVFCNVLSIEAMGFILNIFFTYRVEICSNAVFYVSSCKEGTCMQVLLSNDDGIYAVGLRALYAALREAGHTVHVVAPMTEQSAVGHSLTVFQPLRAKEIVEGDFIGLGVHGTPTDCVKLALSTLLPKKPDVVMSGINAGANVGPDIMYSGTVAAATEAAHAGYAALAFSYDNFRPVNLMEQARHAVKLAENMDFTKVPARCVVNVNYPHVSLGEHKGLKVCPQTTALWHDDYIEKQDPRENKYWWLRGEMRPSEVEANTDRDLLSKGHITVTPLRFDFTHKEYLASMANMLE